MATSTYKPLGDRVLIEPEAPEQTTKSGIVIPDSAQEKSQTGKVLKVGSGRITDEGKTIPLTVKEGDIIIYSKYGGTELKVGGSDLLIIKENDILAIQES
ncbi:co-chaperone GroES [bacterium]|nr:co-chaperone GroES [Actinomycetota bacterium]MBE32594.1 co-chaperone GroES [bacterium]|tara:strand:+ start:1112 stop:1411 length:300 start_codon:yes stop_codon:yes gene_type:complete